MTPAMPPRLTIEVSIRLRPVGLVARLRRRSLTRLCQVEFIRLLDEHTGRAPVTPCDVDGCAQPLWHQGAHGAAPPVEVAS